MTRRAHAVIHGSLHQRLYTGWIRRQNPWLKTEPMPRPLVFMWGIITGIAFCAAIAWVTMR